MELNKIITFAQLINILKQKINNNEKINETRSW